jgi:uncharacterized protein YjiS (DUF1127 family)
MLRRAQVLLQTFHYHMRFRISCAAPILLHRRRRFLYLLSDSGVIAGRKDNKNMLLPIIRFVKAWKRYGVAVQELSHLSDRELADIGITRGDISRVAWEHSRR